MSPAGPAEGEIQLTRLPNGLTIVSEALATVKTASVGVWVAAGSRHEREDEHGLSHLIEHMAFKGTERRSARRIAEDIENVGGDINAATSTEFTSYTARVLGENVDLAVDVLGDIITNSTFDRVELGREIGVILQEYASVEDTPEDVVADAFMDRAFSGQPIGRPILGRPETIRTFDEGMIRSFLEREYTPGRMVVAAAGAVEHDLLVAATEAALGGLPGREAPTAEPAVYTGGDKRLRRRLEQASFTFGFPGVSFSDPGYFATQVFAQALGGGLTSRLWHEVREVRGLAYAVDAFHWPFTDTGILGIGAGTGAGSLVEAVEVIACTAREAVASLAQDELARAKAQLKVSLLAALETPAGRIERAARQLLAWGHIVPAEETVAKVDAVTVETARLAGERALSGALTVAAIGPLRSLPALPRLEALFHG